MSSISAGTTSTTGYVVTSDTTGALVLKTGASATTAVTIDTSQNVSLAVGSANGVTYLNGSKVLTSGSALTFDGTNFATTGSGTLKNLLLSGGTLPAAGNPSIALRSSDNVVYHQSGSANSIVMLDSAQNTMQSIGATAQIWNISNAEQMRLTSTGLGIGTSSPSSKLTVVSTGSTIELKQNSTGAATYYVMDNTIETGGKRWRFGYTGGAGIPCFSLFNQTDNLVSWVADASGNLGLGVTPSAWSTTYSKAIQLPSGALSTYTTIALNMSQNTYFTNSGFFYTNNGFAERYEQYNGTHAWYTAPSGTAGNAISFTQAATLAADGSYYVGCTTTPDGTTGGSAFYAQSVGRRTLRIACTTTGGAGLAEFVNPNGLVGTISTSGSATTYGTSSDYRLKNTIAPMTGALAKVALLKPCTYKWNADGSDGQGFIAHELAEVVPQCVTGEKDAVDEDGNPKYQGIDTSFLVATLTAAIQEQQAIIESLKARLAAANL